MDGFPALLALALLSPGHAGTVPPRPPAVLDALPLSSDTVLVRSRDPIEKLQLTGLWERYDYYAEFSPDRRQARVLLVSAGTNLTVTASYRCDPKGRLRTRQTITVPHPSRQFRRK